MISLTEYERAVRRDLIGRARQATDDAASSLITYAQLWEKHPLPRAVVGDSAPGIGQAWSVQLGSRLYHVATYEHEHGRPLLTALVVRKSDRTSGSGFAVMARELGRKVGHDEQAFWAAELANVVSFWADPDPTRALDALLERVLTELSTVKSRLRALEKAAATTL